MTERFREPDRAVSFVSTGLLHDFPSGRAEVILLSRAKSRRILCSMSEVNGVLRGFCKDFHRASVDYFPGNPDGVVAEIRAHSDGTEVSSERNHGKKTKHKERPLVIVVVQPSDTTKGVFVPNDPPDPPTG